MVLKLDEVKFLDVKGFNFMDFSEKEKLEVSEFQMTELNLANKTLGVTPELIRQERNHATKASFNVSPIVKKYRGLAKQEQEDLEKKIEDEIQRRLQATRDQAYQEGIEKGRQEGLETIQKELQASSEQKMQLVAQIAEEIKQSQEKMVQERLQDTYELIKTLTKWVVLRELKEDGEYIKRLLEKLVVELKSKSNILIKVDRQTFTKIPEALSAVQEVLGKMENVRVEIDHDLTGGGMIVEASNGIIDGTMNAQFEHLDKLFETVISHE